MSQIFVGQIVHCKSINDLVILTNGFLAIEDGKIKGIGEITELESWKSINTNFNASQTIQLSTTQFLLPGFIDCHIHAPQMPNIGLGLDKPLLQWLDQYTFPLESQFKSEQFAENVYKKVIRRTLSNGTTLAAYFGTIHEKSTFILAEQALKQGQRAFVGKPCSNCCSPDYYIETTEDALTSTTALVEKILSLNDSLVQPIITPRFAISCDTNLMMGLAAIAKKHNLFVQTHISENVDEIKYVEDLYKKSYSEVYDDVNILNDKCILAHGVHLKDSELQLIEQRGSSIAHCPASNIHLSSGICDVKRLLNANIKVGLGTDVAGGNSSSILSIIRETLTMSHHLEFAKKQHIIGCGHIELDTEENRNYIPVTFSEALYLATLGGARALGHDKIIGNFVVGKEFDALLVDVDAGQIDIYDLPQSYVEKQTAEEKLLSLVQKFVYVGDDRNIKKVFVRGKQVKCE